MCYKLINFIEISSNSLLNVINDAYDADNKSVYQNENIIYINIDEFVKQTLELHILSLLKGEMFFGQKNILINTCRPCDNWRKKNRGKSIKACKYSITDKYIYIDKQKLEALLNKIWKNIPKKVSNITLIDNRELDILDLTIAIGKILAVNCSTKKPHYHILCDSNNEYIHDNIIPAYIITQLETNLRTKNLII